MNRLFASGLVACAVAGTLVGAATLFTNCFQPSGSFVAITQGNATKTIYANFTASCPNNGSTDCQWKGKLEVYYGGGGTAVPGSPVSTTFNEVCSGTQRTLLSISPGSGSYSAVATLYDMAGGTVNTDNKTISIP